MSSVIGIDLGTANCCVSVLKDGEPIVIPDTEGRMTMPSMFSMDVNYEPIVGHAAKTHAPNNRLNTIFAVKRLIGKKYKSPEVTEAVNRLPYKIIRADNGDAWVQVNDTTMSPEQVSSYFLAEMRNVAEAFLGEKIQRAVVTVPAHFNDSQRQATKDAGKIAGLDVLRIINEPTAAALAYGLNLVDIDDPTQSSERNIAVFDLGGGTFDITILGLSDGVFEVKSTGGDTYLGGEDFDLEIMNHLLVQFKKQCGVDVSEDKVALQRLKMASKEAKHDLSYNDRTVVELPFLSSKSYGGAASGHLAVELKRSEMEDIIRPVMKRLEEPCFVALEDAKLEPEEISEVILVGGMTKMPAVKKACLKIFKSKPNDTVNPDEVVAAGAAIQAGLLQGLVKGVSLRDVTSLTLGLETQGGVTTAIIPRNTKVPAKITEIFTTSSPNQTKVDIHVLQGESRFAPDNKTLGKFELSGINPAPRGVPKIEVTFEVDVEGIVHVSAKDVETGEHQKIEIIASSGLSDEDLDKLVRDNAKLEASEADGLTMEDRIPDDVKEALGCLKNTIFTTQFILDTDGTTYKGGKRTVLDELLWQGREALDKERDIEAISELSARLENAKEQLEQFIDSLY